ncbi:phytanoyl-CoA dioxygenase family protein [Candidatus Pelagibacter sp.]|nr:phytanoyl-CoA dioxygenase family protein [Candidatus Pelagibacter sp.]
MKSSNQNKYSFIFNDKKKKQIDDDGYCIFEPDKNLSRWLGVELNFLSDKIDSLLEEEGEFAGYDGREEFFKKGKKFEPIANRLGNLPNKSKHFLSFCDYPPVIDCAKYIIKDDICLSSSNFREPLKNGKQQRLHIDWLPRFKESESFDCVIAMLYLDDSKLKNGALKIVPGTHKKLGYPDQYCNPFIDHSESKSIVVKKGSIIVLNSNIWHRGGANLSGERRRIINSIYRKRTLKQGLCQKKYLSKTTISNMSTEQQKLFKVLKEDNEQKEKIFGPGNDYRQWLEKNPKFNYSKSNDLTIKHY